ARQGKNHPDTSTGRHPRRRERRGHRVRRRVGGLGRVGDRRGRRLPLLLRRRRQRRGRGRRRAPVARAVQLVVDLLRRAGGPHQPDERVELPGLGEHPRDVRRLRRRRRGRCWRRRCRRCRRRRRGRRRRR
ncbi:hypothetical protein EE612_000394, partial [Oryza sativa]